MAYRWVREFQNDANAIERECKLLTQQGRRRERFEAI